jgi:hypothetical protein
MDVCSIVQDAFPTDTTYMNNAQNITTGQTFIARSGDTAYTLMRRTTNSKDFIVQVSVLWKDKSGADQWHVSNDRARFTSAHIATQLETGNWTAA